MIAVAMFFVWLAVAIVAILAIVASLMGFTLYCKFYNNVMSRTDAASTYKRK